MGAAEDWAHDGGSQKEAGGFETWWDSGAFKGELKPETHYRGRGSALFELGRVFAPGSSHQGDTKERDGEELGYPSW